MLAPLRNVPTSTQVRLRQRCPRRRRERRKGSSGHPRAARHRRRVRGRSGAVRSGSETSSELVAEAGDHAGDRGVELGLGQRPLVVAQRQPVGEALVGLGQGSPAVDVEQGHAPEQRAAVAPDCGLDLGGRTVRGDDDGQVALDGGLARRCGYAMLRRLAAGQARDRELGDVDPLGAQVERGDDSGWSSPSRPTRRPPAVTRAARPGWRFGSSTIGVEGGARRYPSRRQTSSTMPFASSRSYGARRPIPGRRLRAAR